MTPGPQFQFFQAPPGPDASRQYSDWTDAILARGDAIQKPLLMLMQSLADKQAQQRHIAARNAERRDELDYRKSRDVVHDVQFQQDHALRESAESRQIQRDQYSQAQDTANVDLLMSMMAPRNSVETPSPEYQALQGMRGGQQAVPFSPLGGVGPSPSVMDDALRTQERRRESDQKQEALDKQSRMEGEYFQHAAESGLVSKADAPRLKMLVGQGEKGRDEAHKIIEKGRTDQSTVAERKRTAKELFAYWDAHPDDPNVQRHAAARPILESLSKTAQFPTLWDGLYKEATEATMGLGKQPPTEKTPTLAFGDVKFDVPPYVAAGGSAKGTLPPDVENWIKDSAFSLMQKDKRLEGELGQAMRGKPEQMQALMDEKAQAVRQRVQSDFGWKIEPAKADGAGSPGGKSEPSSAAAPSAQQPAAQQQPDPLASLPPDVVKAAHAARAQGPEAVRAVLMQAIEADRAEARKPANSGVVGSEWLKRNPEPKWWWDMNSGYSSALKKAGFRDSAKAHAAWEKAWNSGAWGEDTPWAGKIVQ